MAFTTWTDLHAALKNALADSVASGNFVTTEMEIDTGGQRRRFKYRSFDEMRQALSYVKLMADQESGTKRYGRTYAKSGGRG